MRRPLSGSRPALPLTPLDFAYRSRAIAQELARIDHAAVFPDFEMHVRAGGTASGTRLSDYRADADEIASLHHQSRIVRVAGDVAIAMVHIHHVAVAALDASEADHAI